MALRNLLMAFVGVFCCLIASSNALAAKKSPPLNFVVIYCDDLGYGDVGCFGSKKHRTPHIDEMAEDGLKLTSFYVTSGVCTPSRSSLMTGCYPRRVNMHIDSRGAWVLFPRAKKGLHPKEVTLAEVLKARGYSTAIVGKWHLGDQPKFLPTRQGFDRYFGIPYSNDMGKGRRNYPPLPLLRNETVIESEPDQSQLTKRYTEEAVKFITENKDKPFFLYLPHTMPHNPVHASEAFRGKSKNGRYGDAVEEIDWSTGRILKTLSDLGLEKNTLVLFTSDNGAASRWGGSNAPLSGYKGSTMEGGMRVPCVVRWPGRIPAGTQCDEVASTIDLLPTFANLAGTSPPQDRIIDGKDIRSLLLNPQTARSPHEVFYYYFRDQLQAVRSGKWKLHLPRMRRRRSKQNKSRTIPARLYDLHADIAEKKNVASDHPDVVKHLTTLAEQARRDLGDGKQQGKNQRPAGFVENPVPLTKNSR